MKGGKVGDGKRKREEDGAQELVYKKHRGMCGCTYAIILLTRTKGTETQKWFCFSALPPELQIRVFEFLHPKDVMSNVSRVCKEWANLLTEDSLWHTLHVQHFGRIERPGKTWRLQCKEVLINGFFFKKKKKKKKKILIVNCHSGNAKSSTSGTSNAEEAFLLGSTLRLHRVSENNIKTMSGLNQPEKQMGHTSPLQSCKKGTHRNRRVASGAS